jgi:A/G-specific adenine glycosylase
MMLQQTGTGRVLAKYGEFLAAFPHLSDLAAAPLRDVLARWKGLGYNRRALYLHEAARRIRDEHSGRMPRTVPLLSALPGIGTATASAVLVFSRGIPLAFIETNIRRVFLHFFFPGAASVHDREIMPLVAEALDRDDPREWYYALMDYGSMLRTAVPNPNRRSAHYHRQAPFEGSIRQARGQVLSILLESGTAGEAALTEALGREPAEALAIIAGLEREGFIRRAGKSFRLS